MFTFKDGALSAAAIAGLICIGTPASASTVFDLNIISSSTIGSGTLGTVTLTQNGAKQVDVAVALINAAFVDTGGPHNAFAFNLDLSSALVTVTSPLPPTGSPAIFVPSGAGGTNTPYGSFTNVINCPGCGPGGSNANLGPLEFMVTNSSGISISDFIANESGYFFSADVLGTAAGTGGTGSIAVAPLPPAILFFASGLSMMGLLGWWKKRKDKLTNAAALAAA
jgi:hypothetical protein